MSNNNKPLTKTQHQQFVAAELGTAPAWLIWPPAQEVAPQEDLIHQLEEGGLDDGLGVDALLQHDLLKEAQETSDDGECHDIPTVVEMLGVAIDLHNV